MVQSLYVEVKKPKRPFLSAYGWEDCFRGERRDCKEENEQVFSFSLIPPPCFGLMMLVLPFLLLLTHALAPLMREIPTDIG